MRKEMNATVEMFDKGDGCELMFTRTTGDSFYGQRRASQIIHIEDAETTRKLKSAFGLMEASQCQI